MNKIGKISEQKKTEHRKIRGNRYKSGHLLLLLNKTKESTEIRRKSAKSTEIRQNPAKSEKTLQNPKKTLGTDENPDIFFHLFKKTEHPENLQNPRNPKKFKKSGKIQQHPDNPGKSAEIEHPD